MKPGIKLDELILKEVMKLHPEYYYDHPDFDLTLPKVFMGPQYSTDINAAWSVIEKLLEKEFSVQVSAYPKSRKWLTPPETKEVHPREWKLEPGEPYQCTICRYEPDCDAWIVECDPAGESAAHAICVAALIALGVKYE